MLQVKKTTTFRTMLLASFIASCSCSSEEVGPYPVTNKPIAKKFDISQKIADDWMKQYNESTKRDLKRIGEKLKHQNKLKQLAEEEGQLIKKFGEVYALTSEQISSISEKLHNLKRMEGAIAKCDTMINNFQNLKSKLESNSLVEQESKLDTIQPIIGDLLLNYKITNFYEAKKMLADLLFMVENIKQQIVL